MTTLPQDLTAKLDELAYKLIAEHGARLSLVYLGLLAADPDFTPTDPRLVHLRRRVLAAGGARYLLDGDSVPEGGPA